MAERVKGRALNRAETADLARRIGHSEDWREVPGETLRRFREFRFWS